MVTSREVYTGTVVRAMSGAKMAKRKRGEILSPVNHQITPFVALYYCESRLDLPSDKTWVEFSKLS